MNPVEPHGAGDLVTFAKDQPEYNPLPARIDADGVVHTRWSLTSDERRAILDGACIELFLHTFGQPLQPVRIRVEGVEEPVLAEAPA